MTLPARILAAVAACSAVPALAAPPRKTPEMVAKGKASYDVNCASCHGPGGLGDGAAAAVLSPKPRDLVHGKFASGAKPGQIFTTLAKGLPGTAMVSFAYLPEDERWALSYYVADLRAKPAKKK